MKNKTFSVFSLVGLVCLPGCLLGYEGSLPTNQREYPYHNEKILEEPAGIAIHDRVLFKIDDDTVVTTLDVIQKLNLLFASSYPQLLESYPARSQYYTAMWPVVLESVIDEFLMVADAKAKKIQVDPTTVNQEIEAMFGRDLSFFYVHFDMTPEDIFKVVHRTLIAQRVMGMMVRSKVMLKVTPGKIREHYNQLAEEAAKTKLWKYRVVTIKAATESLSSQIADKICARLNETQSWNKERLSALALSQGGQFVCSEEFIRNDKELSDAHKMELSSVNYPLAICSQPKAHKSGHKLYVLLEKSTLPMQPLEEIETQIKQTLFMHYAETIESQYKRKLRARYGFDSSMIAKLLSEEAPPLFSLL
ncbi:hypothetical protein B598_0337 [Chlamydia psittaci GR9]|uniref:PpiC domain-containing protein n=1 Tax=Chlamydophila parapsittaci TaxID=344886 RepID=A0ABX5VZR2_9CHLA|nr:MULTISPECIES: hypothetical protein [Chlamydia]AFS20426.1 hypothetical protein B598_0337 [Chlamydia psittaci GR9]QDE37490.1 hypothetical protein FI836_04275 [Chlamydophila parapsittaci]QHE19151.1 hypothetical protein GR632_04255 [Chlamydia psittaci]